MRDGVKPDTVYDLYREMSSKDIRTDILAEWIRVMGITDPMVSGLLKYRPTTNGREVMADGFKGEEIGREIARREGVKYVELVKKLDENRIIRFGDFQKGING